MLSRNDLRPCSLLASALAYVLLTFSPASFAGPDEPGGYPTEAAIETALQKLIDDPNLSEQRKTRILKWVDDADARPGRSNLWRWISGLFAWIGTTARVAVWFAFGLLAAVLVVAVVRHVRSIELKSDTRRKNIPAHVRDLDIRPETLPDDIGAAAFELWDRGAQRAALSLLYRGLLSRLVHTHSVPIRESSTEGDCLSLVERHLSQERIDYTAGLVRVWQRAVYGGHDPGTADVRALCGEFDRTLAAPRVRSAERSS